MCKPKNLGRLALNKRSGGSSLKACDAQSLGIIALMRLDFLSVSDTAKLGLGIGAAIGMIWTLHRQNQEAGQRIARMEQQLQELHNALVKNVRPYRGGDQC